MTRTFQIEKIAGEDPMTRMSLSCSEKPVWLEFGEGGSADEMKLERTKLYRSL